MGQYNRIAEAIQSLNILPERCALVESEPERTQGLRQMLVDNYSVFYIVGEDAVSVCLLYTSYIAVPISGCSSPSVKP